MKLNNLLFIAQRYPNQFNRTTHVFVKQLVWSLADLGYNCTVIAPVPRNSNKELVSLPDKLIESTDKGNTTTVYFPKYTDYSMLIPSRVYKTRMFIRLFQNAIFDCISNNQIKPDLLYGHFITPAGISAVQIGKMMNLPSFFAYGESTPWSINNPGISWVKQKLTNAKGAVAVSTQNRNQLIKKGIIDKSLVKVFPNAVRREHFYKRNKQESREKFGISNIDFVIAFVGQFTERKGPLRVAKAIENLPDVKGIFAGSGVQKPFGPNILYADKVDPNDMPYFLSAADVFVLPTLQEGCCNAIIEAMACGLPIISSDREFNYDILDNSNAILINPEDVSHIRNAIIELKENSDLRLKMAENSLKKAEHLNYDDRAKAIIEWMEKLINEK